MLELKEKILRKACTLMEQYGLSSVTMDDIAKECHISKRTLYEHIPDKRTLVWQCVLYHRKQHQIEAKTLVLYFEGCGEKHCLHYMNDIREIIFWP